MSVSNEESRMGTLLIRIRGFLIPRGVPSLDALPASYHHHHCLSSNYIYPYSYLEPGDRNGVEGLGRSGAEES